jgi:hypothetical protein
MLVTIDEYDTSLMRMAWDSELHHSMNQRSDIDNAFKRFFSSLKLSNKYNVNVFVTGVSPISLTSYTSGWNHATNLSDFREFAGLYGFQIDDIERGLDLIQPPLPPSFVRKFVKYCEKFNGYRFHPSQPEESRIFNPGRIMFLLRRIERNWKFESHVQHSEDSLFEALLIGNEDTQTKPAESVLTSLGSHPYATSLITSLLQKPDATVVATDSLQDITFKSLNTTREGMISYM